MIAVGTDKAVLVHGDQHPAELYVGDKKIAGFTEQTVTGTGRVEIGEGIYNAALPSVVVRGEGRQEKLTGKNLLDPKKGIRPTPRLAWYYKNDGLLLTGGVTYTFSVSRTAKALNFISVPDGAVLAGAGNAKKLTFTPKSDVKSFFQFAVEGENMTDLEYNTVQLEASPAPTPYEPYCGGIPAPNPEYPIEPKFLEGASVVARGRNLIDPSETSFNGVDRTDAYLKDGLMLKAGTYTASQKDDRLLIAIDFQSGKWISSITGQNALTFSIDVDKKVRFAFISSSGRPENLQLEQGPVSTPYTPYYDGGTAPLPILRALPDGSVQDEIDLRTGTVMRKIKEIRVKDILRLEWATWGVDHFIAGQTGFYYYDHDLVEKPLCATSTHFTFLNYFEYNRVGFGIAAGVYIYFIMPNTLLDITDNVAALNSFLEWLDAENPIAYCAVKTPIIEHYDPAILRQHPGYTQLIQQGGELTGEIAATAYMEDDHG